MDLNYNFDKIKDNLFELFDEYNSRLGHLSTPATIPLEHNSSKLIGGS